MFILPNNAMTTSLLYTSMPIYKNILEQLSNSDLTKILNFYYYIRAWDFFHLYLVLIINWNSSSLRTFIGRNDN